MPDGVVEAELCALLSGRPEPTLRKAGAFPHELRIVRRPSGGAPIILRVIENTATIIDAATAAGYLREYVSYLAGPLGDFNVVYARCKSIVDSWSHQGDHMLDLPKAVGFKSDPDICMTRLLFDPILIDDDLALRTAAPLFYEMLGRCKNAEAFCMRLGSLFDPDADRKQAVWMSGPPDCGKSEFSWLLTVLSGESYGILSNADLKTPYWKAQLVGKRVGLVNEAAARFIRSDEFKAITGDDEHAINQKNVPIFHARLPVLMFFFSNNPPEIPHDDALMARIIDCRIAPIARGAVLPKRVVRQKLLEELPYIAGYCLARYQSLECGERIPCTTTELHTTIDSYEATYLDFIETHYVEDADSYILRQDFYEAMMAAGIKAGDEQRRCKRVLTNRYGCTEVRQRFDTNEAEFGKKRIFVIKGIRCRKEAESQFLTGRNPLIRGQRNAGDPGGKGVLAVVQPTPK